MMNNDMLTISAQYRHVSDKQVRHHCACCAYIWRRDFPVYLY